MIIAACQLYRFTWKYLRNICTRPTTVHYHVHWYAKHCLSFSQHPMPTPPHASLFSPSSLFIIIVVVERDRTECTFNSLCNSGMFCKMKYMKLVPFRKGTFVCMELLQQFHGKSVWVYPLLVTVTASNTRIPNFRILEFLHFRISSRTHHHLSPLPALSFVHKQGSRSQDAPEAPPCPSALEFGKNGRCVGTSSFSRPAQASRMCPHHGTLARPSQVRPHQQGKPADLHGTMRQDRWKGANRSQLPGRIYGCH